MSAGSLYSLGYISKLVVRAETREEAIQRMRRAVSEYKVVGIATTLPFFGRVLRHPAFVAGEIDTSFVEMFFAEEADSPGSHPEGTDLAARRSR